MQQGSIARWGTNSAPFYVGAEWILSVSIDDPIALEAVDIPPPELRPAADKLWGCTQPGAQDGEFVWVAHWPD